MVCSSVCCMLSIVYFLMYVVTVVILSAAAILGLGTLTRIGSKVDNASRRFSCALESFPGDIHPSHTPHPPTMAGDARHSSESEHEPRPAARKRSQKWMTKGALVREDSDDELGDEDHPWDWIFDAEPEVNGDSEVNNASPTKSNRRRSSRPAQKKRTIIGAKMGSFECRLGQIVLLKSPEAGKDWVGIITEFVEEDDEEQEGEVMKNANIMWFAGPDEFLSTRNKQRTDALPNEQYLTADFNLNPLNSINGKATVMSKQAFFARYPNGVAPKNKAELLEYNKCIVCRRGVNQVQGRYTEEFVWEEVYDENNILKLISLVKEGLKAARKRKTADSDVRSTWKMFADVLTLIQLLVC